MPASVMNTASAYGLDPNLVVVSDDSAPVTIDAVQTAELTTTKTTTEVGYAAVGEVLDYVIEVTNTGNVTVTGVTRQRCERGHVRLFAVESG